MQNNASFGISVFLMVVLCKSVAAADTNSKEGVASPAVGKAIDSTFDYSKHAFNTTNNYNFSTRYECKITPLQRMHAALFLYNHPTTLEITGTKISKWLADGDFPVLSFILKNSSSLPALNIKIDVMNTKSGKTYQALKPYKLPRCRTYREIEGKFSVASQSDLVYPMVQIQELRKIILASGMTDPDNYCFIAPGSMLSGNKPLTPNSKIKSANVNTLHFPLLVRVRYSTIFGQHGSFMKWVFVDLVNRKSIIESTDSDGSIDLGCLD